jgi:hypothetical protein
MTGGCLVEYVLPEGDSSGDRPGDTGDRPGDTGDSTGHVVTGDPAPTTGTAGATGDGQTTGDPCDQGLSRCGEACVDLSRDDAHCGSCGESCKSDELCVASECRDVLPVECAMCPCDACSASGVLESTTSGGGDAEQYLCCPPPDGADSVICLVGDPEDPLACPDGGG